MKTRDLDPKKREDLFTYLPIPVDDRVPEGYRLILAYAKGDAVVVPIEPIGLSDEEHNCDWEGCSTLNHVVRFSISHKYEAEERVEKANLTKEIAINILRSTVASGDGGYVANFGPVTFSNLIKLVTGGDDQYCARNGHIIHENSDMCICCHGSPALSEKPGEQG